MWGGKPSQAFADFFPRIERQVQEQVVTRLIQADTALTPPTGMSLLLGEVKDFASSAIHSQVTGASITDESFLQIAEKILDRTIGRHN